LIKLLSTSSIKRREKLIPLSPREWEETSCNPLKFPWPQHAQEEHCFFCSKHLRWLLGHAELCSQSHGWAHPHRFQPSWLHPAPPTIWSEKCKVKIIVVTIFCGHGKAFYNESVSKLNSSRTFYEWIRFVFNVQLLLWQCIKIKFIAEKSERSTFS